MVEKITVQDFLKKDFCWDESYLYEMVRLVSGDEKVEESDRYKLHLSHKSSRNPFFGVISPENAPTGAYSGLSYVVFPPKDQLRSCLYTVTLNVGTGDYGNDVLLAKRPGIRRTMRDLLKECNVFCEAIKYKLDFYDNRSKIHGEAIPEPYRTTTLAYAVVDVSKEDGRLVMLAILNWYARDLRDWGKKGVDTEIQKMIKDKKKQIEQKNQREDKNGGKKDIDTDKENVCQLLAWRRFVVLQGAPGTGKTRLAKEIAKEKGGEIFFTQFHAETTYADFVCGIVPDTDGTVTATDREDDTKSGKANELKFKEREGVLMQAIRAAIKLEKTRKDVYLIIDEINRANLPNVLGEAFYLFEPGLNEKEADETWKGVCLGKDLWCKQLPSNLYVLATMNTADRSLAVVDFALRRRFAWYTMEPHIIKLKGEKIFCETEFHELSTIFYKYASDEELNLMPGHAYFIVSEENQKEEMKQRVRYELMPLIKEYLSAGMMIDASEEFYQFFLDYAEEEMFR